jgi:hypothetical protein
MTGVQVGVRKRRQDDRDHPGPLSVIVSRGFATFGIGALMLLAGCASSATQDNAPAPDSPSPATARFIVVSSDWLQVSAGTADQVVHPAANCSLDALNRQTCVPQPDRVVPGIPPTYKAHAVVRNDGDESGTVSVVMGAMGTNCSASSAVTSPGSSAEVSCEIGPVARLDIPPLVAIPVR